MNAALLFFEVMDKEPSLQEIWIFSLIVAIGGFFLVRLNPLLLIFPLLLALSYGWLQVSEINDPFVGPDIITEAGYGYVVQSYLAIAISTITPFFGIVFWIERPIRRAGNHST